MAGFLKTVLLPLLIALTLYLLTTLLLLPLYRRHHHNRARYSQYLPLPVPASLQSSLPSSSSLSNLRHYLQDTLSSFLLPPRLRRQQGLGLGRGRSRGSGHSSRRRRGERRVVDCSRGDEEGEAEEAQWEDLEDLAGTDADADDDETTRPQHREALEQQRRRSQGLDSLERDERRLSRELEEGFRDESEDENDEDGGSGEEDEDEDEDMKRRRSISRVQ
ncbi:hypothetical protein LTS18_008184 [Coniosporium uncinatum]|uniref:Uncharacterized protein n=1 Tax=Coniosporium uncinatum TaxID=93489 RepID=A0ACC3DNC5_9PEZI|nr:hypothetical protein LTS18_008184 [Coniosporium uncinatum]